APAIMATRRHTHAMRMLMGDAPTALHRVDRCGPARRRRGALVCSRHSLPHPAQPLDTSENKLHGRQSPSGRSWYVGRPRDDANTGNLTAADAVRIDPSKALTCDANIASLGWNYARAQLV